MLTRRDLDRPAAELLALLRERASPHMQVPSAPRPWRELACMFELEDEVRNGGFSQYFFNHSCANAFDAWAATRALADPAHALLDRALLRIGAEYGVDLDLARLSERRDDLARAHAGLLDNHARTRRAHGGLINQYVAFAQRLATDLGPVAGFDALERRYFEQSNLPAAIAAHVARHPDAYLIAAR